MFRNTIAQRNVIVRVVMLCMPMWALCSYPRARKPTMPIGVCLRFLPLGRKSEKTHK